MIVVFLSYFSKYNGAKDKKYLKKTAAKDYKKQFSIPQNMQVIVMFFP